MSKTQDITAEVKQAKRMARTTKRQTHHEVWEWNGHEWAFFDTFPNHKKAEVCARGGSEPTAIASFTFPKVEY